VILVPGNGLDIPLGEDAVGFLLRDRLVIRALFVFVMFLDQQPVRLGFVRCLAAHAHQHPFAVQLLAMKNEFEIALGQPLVRVAHRLPCAFIPKHHRTAPVLALGDGPFEASVLDGMILDLYRQALISGHITRPLGNRPTLENPVQAQAEVVVQASGCMLLDNEGQRFGRRRRFGPATWFGRLAEIAHRAITLELLVDQSRRCWRRFLCLAGHPKPFVLLRFGECSRRFRCLRNGSTAFSAP
jgi:hypothetical protein